MVHNQFKVRDSGHIVSYRPMEYQRMEYLICFPYWLLVVWFLTVYSMSDTRALGCKYK